MAATEPQPVSEKQNADAFSAMVQDLLDDHEGKYGLIHNLKLVEVFDTMEADYKNALDQFGTDPVFIGHIRSEPDTEQLPALYHGLINIEM